MFQNENDLLNLNVYIVFIQTTDKMEFIVVVVNEFCAVNRDYDKKKNYVQ